MNHHRRYESYEECKKRWGERAEKGDMLQAVIDPGEHARRRNSFFDFMQKKVLSKYLTKTVDILDFGCGTGRFLIWLSSRSRSVVGIDAMKEMLSMAIRNTSNKENVEVGLGTCTCLPCRDESFDNVLSAVVLSFLTLAKDDAEKGANEIVRVLKTGGISYVIDQVNAARRSVGDIVNAFETNSCKCLVQEAIFRDRSKITYLISRIDIPKFIYRLLAELELLLARHSFQSKRAQYEGYYFLVFRKG
jgi:ubiquinone/menaquinone biosynthesis C-methylase UbiE